MATINYGTKELTCKVVYYGPGFGGKTTNLQQIHARLPQGSKGELTSLATQEDRTLFFDLLPMDMGKVGDFSVRLQLYTVPGQVQYNATRKVVLKGVDGVVIVFDSDPRRENANYLSLANLEENLESHGHAIRNIPVVFQYNKRDLADAMDLKFLKGSLNPDGFFPDFEAVAMRGVGVMESVQKVCSLIFGRIEGELASQRTRVAPSRRSGSPKTAEKRPREPISSAETQMLPARVDGRVSLPEGGRIRQLSDLWMLGIQVGHGIVDVSPGTPGANEPDLMALLDLRPLGGTPHIERLSFWRSDRRSDGGRILETYETRGAAAGCNARLIVEHPGNRVARIYLDWTDSRWKTLLLPEGCATAPSLEAAA